MEDVRYHILQYVACEEGQAPMTKLYLKSKFIDKKVQPRLKIKEINKTLKFLTFRCLAASSEERNKQSGSHRPKEDRKSWSMWVELCVCGGWS